MLPATLSRRCGRALIAGGIAIACLLSGSPVSAQVDLRALVEVADMSGLAISPDGRLIAFRVTRPSVEHNEHQSTWFVQPLAGGEAVRVADGGVPLRTYSGTLEREPGAWSPDSHWFYFRALRDGAVELWRASAIGARVERVAADAGDVRSFATIGSDRLVYSAGPPRNAILAAEAREYDSGILIDETTPIGGGGLFRSAYLGGRLASPRYTGRWMRRQTLLADQPASYRTIDLDTGQVREAEDGERVRLAATPEDGTVPDGREGDVGVARALAVATADPAELKVRWPDGRELRCPAGACGRGQISWIRWRGSRDEIVFAARDRERGGGQALYRWRLPDNRLVRITGSPGLLNGGSTSSHADPCTVGERDAVCVEAAANMPPRLVRIDLETGRRTALHEPNADLARRRRARAELLLWQDANGRRFTGQFYPALTTDGRAPPLFIVYYACNGFIRGGSGEEWPLSAMAERGIAALCVNAAEPAAGGTEPRAVASYQTGLEGIAHVLPVLRLRGVDTQRVGMGGFSFGSEVLMWTAMHANLLTAASVASGMVTPTYMRFHDIQGDDFRRSIREGWGLGSPDETPGQWRRLSPIFNLDRLRLPLLMHLPEQEYISAIDYFSPLRRAGAPIEMWVFPHEPHNKFQPRHRLAIFQRNLDWFRFWLQDYEDPAPGRQAQYARWRAMRQRMQQAR